MKGRARKGHHYYACAYAAELRRDRGPRGPRRPEVGLRARGLARAARAALLRAADLRPDARREAREAASGPRPRAAAQRQARRDPDAPADRRSSSARSRPRWWRSRRGSSPNWSPSGSPSSAARRQALEEALARLGAERQEAEDEELTEQLARIPDLTQALREAPVAIKRQVFESFDLQIAYDKRSGRVELTATVSEAVADAFENAKALQSGGLQRGTERHSGGGI